MEAIRRNEQGRVVARLSVAPNGAVDACAIAQSSGYGALDRRTCLIALRRGRFLPARDGRGRPIRFDYPLKVRWVLPQ